MKDFHAGRASGLDTALKIVKDGGIEALEEEIRFRNASGVDTSYTVKELSEASQKIKEMVLDTMIAVSVLTLRDEFDFGQKRCQRFIDRMTKKAGSLGDGLATWNDYLQAIKDEMNIDLVIRYND